MHEILILYYSQRSSTHSLALLTKKSGQP